MALSGGHVKGLRGRGDIEVDIAWMGRNIVKKSRKSQSNSRYIGGNGYVQAASVLFRAPHPWYSAGIKPGGTGGMIENSAGFFSWVRNDSVNTQNDVKSEVIIVYPLGRKALRLSSNHKNDKGIECARESPLQPFVTSDDLNIAVNPHKYVNWNDKNSTNKGSKSDQRQGLKIEIYKYPCQIYLK
jgi:hypothetical protein